MSVCTCECVCMHVYAHIPQHDSDQQTVWQPRPKLLEDPILFYFIIQFNTIKYNSYTTIHTCNIFHTFNTYNAFDAFNTYAGLVLYAHIRALNAVVNGPSSPHNAIVMG